MLASRPPGSTSRRELCWRPRRVRSTRPSADWVSRTSRDRTGHLGVLRDGRCCPGPSTRAPTSCLACFASDPLHQWRGVVPRACRVDADRRRDPIAAKLTPAVRAGRYLTLLSASRHRQGGQGFCDSLGPNRDERECVLPPNHPSFPAGAAGGPSRCDTPVGASPALAGDRRHRRTAGGLSTARTLTASPFTEISFAVSRGTRSAPSSYRPTVVAAGSWPRTPLATAHYLPIRVEAGRARDCTRGRPRTAGAAASWCSTSRGRRSSAPFGPATTRRRCHPRAQDSSLPQAAERDHTRPTHRRWAVFSRRRSRRPFG